MKRMFLVLCLAVGYAYLSDINSCPYENRMECLAQACRATVLLGEDSDKFRECVRKCTEKCAEAETAVAVLSRLVDGEEARLDDFEDTEDTCQCADASDGIALLTPVEVTKAPEYFTTPVMTWAQAEQYCVKEGGHLASIHSEEEDAIVAQFMKDNTSTSYPWIGAYTFTCSNGCGGNTLNEYYWTDGTPFDYQHSSWVTNDAAPTWGHYYRSGSWGTWCGSCQSEGICQK